MGALDEPCLDFGESRLYGRPVRPLVVRAALNTAVLALVALALVTVVGLGLGIVMGSRRGPIPVLIRGASLVCLSLPPLITSLLLVFAAARTGWLPAGGISSVEVAGSAWARLFDVLWHLPVPARALAAPVAAMFERLQAQAR